MKKKKNPNPFRNPQSACQGNSKMVGGYVPLPLADHLRLLSVYYEKSLQSLVQEIMDEWCKAANKSEKEIIDILVERAITEWQRRVLEAGTISRQAQEGYLGEIEEALKRRKVADHHRITILEKLKPKVGSIG